MLKIVAILGVTCLLDLGTPHMVGNNPNHRREVLDSQGKYLLEWRIDWEGKRVIFNVTAETRGWVGFGLSRNGKMSGADVVIGGVRKNGKAYFSDRHAVGNQVPEIDSRQDWVLHWAQESQTHTMLSFSRAFDTCDPQDYRITEDRIVLIWAYGVNDNESQYHFRSRGVFNVLLLHKDYSPEIINNVEPDTTQIVPESGNLKVWRIRRVKQLPPEETTYWCSMHKAPRHPRKHHIVGMETWFGSEESRRFIHHILVFRCTAPRSHDPRAFFGPYLSPRHPGQECLRLRAPSGPMPTEYCTEHINGWATGGRAFFHPPHVGIPFVLSRDEYYVVQIHYDNPNRLNRPLLVDVRLDYFYTDKLRPFEGGLLTVRVPAPGSPPTLLIPPSSVDHTVMAHCSPDCTYRMFPQGGIHVYMTSLHSHKSSRTMRIHHFRKGKQLPWIVSNENYVTEFQQVSALPQEVTILPGDQLTTGCVYDNTWTNGTVVGGFASKQEMCAGYLYYYPKLEGHQTCDSQLGPNEDHLRSLLGVGNITWSNTDLEFHVDAPHPLQGLSISEVADKLEWTLKRRAQLQRLHLEGDQVGICNQELYAAARFGGGGPEEFSTPVRYPVAIPNSGGKQY